jgi:hypothetical protein
MAFATIWVDKEGEVSAKLVGGNVRLQLGDCVVWLTPEHWAALITREPLAEPVPLRLQQLRPVAATIHPLTAPEFVRSPDEAA